MNKDSKHTQILLVEDDPDIAQIIGILLEEKGYAVQALLSVEPAEAIALRADLIILDHMLGSQLGSDICLRLKKDPASAHIPVILCSATQNLPALHERCHADAFITKPFDINDFMLQVETLLSKTD